MAAAVALIAYCAPDDAYPGLSKKIFYVHVPRALRAYACVLLVELAGKRIDLRLRARQHHRCRRQRDEDGRRQVPSCLLRPVRQRLRRPNDRPAWTWLLRQRYNNFFGLNLSSAEKQDLVQFLLSI